MKAPCTYGGATLSTSPAVTLRALRGSSSMGAFTRTCSQCEKYNEGTVVALWLAYKCS